MTGPVLVNAPLVAMASAVETSGAATMAGTSAGAAGPVTAILPPGAEDASAAAAAGFVARGAETMAMMTQLGALRSDNGHQRGRLSCHRRAQRSLPGAVARWQATAQHVSVRRRRGGHA
jgi:hypothetical protein